MNGQYKVDGATALSITTTVQAAGEEASQSSTTVESALDDVAAGGSGSPVIGAALARFVSARRTTAGAIASHLATVGHVGRSAVTVVAQADEEAARAARGLT